MPFKYELTWVKHAKRWRKRYQGETFYLTTPTNGKRDRAGYLAALREWERLKSYLDGFAPNPYVGSGRRRVLIPEDQMPSVSPQTSSVTINPQSNGHDKTNGASIHGASIEAPPWMDMNGLFADLHPELVAPPAPNPQHGERRISKLIDRYLEKRQQRAVDGKLSLKQLGEDKRQLEVFHNWLLVNYATSVVMIDQVTAPVLNHFRDHQETLCNSETTLRKRLQVVRKWFLWLLDESVITTPPRDLTTYGRIEVTREQPQFLTVEEIRSVFRESNPLLQCCISLSLNAGFTQQDCSTLTQEHIDFESGILSRGRQKTGVEQRAKLWPITRELLRTCGHFDSSEPLLRTPAGQPLVTERINAKGNVSKTDHVAYLFGKAAKTVGLTGRTFKHLRKTASNEVEKRNPSLTSLFLSHAERATKRFYVTPHFDDLFAITDELNSLFALSGND